MPEMADQHSKMRQYGLALEKYWVMQSGYFRIGTTVALSVGITYAKILLCRGIGTDNKYKAVSMREYNDRTVFGYFNNPFF